ncbi:xanthine dehydrogenase accessory protein XdhC [Notoacmeibacter ruber]|uniref:Xanthine dehydrogenase accessory protein XdhC n=1 Tax=Notoacmeibacter ruber TaxID=2670375 RepID=A0A3L7JBW4_9HYPH|nr:xanthine dehydrogenase accessory protein XdhC [Notoacmeibacter ruber]RLQ88248.1 xanthine dehydrogenase accessory protein XdhC [Notoacmeibacter ruber]
MRASDLVHLIQAAEPAIRISVTDTKGSTPREAGASMIVTEARTIGTIGGGTLEFRALERAHDMLKSHQTTAETMELPLGPEIGQCCGGRVALSLQPVDLTTLLEIHDQLREQESRQPEILIFGGGHVGTALARALAPLPFRSRMVETRPDILPDGLPVPSEILAMPEALVSQAKAGSAIVVLTHDHALDFMIISEAMQRDDLAYIGMIGSKTKRATFASHWLDKGGASEKLKELICPIGGSAVSDKRPEVIAAMVAAEITQSLISFEV